MLKKYDSLILTGYKIVSSPVELDKESGITPEIRKILEITLKKVLNKKKNVKDDILKLIDQYPHLPQFKNYLSTYYSYNNELEEAFKINQQIVKDHPDYFFGKINLALEYLSKKKFEKIPEILGEAMEIKSLYPDREVFHIEEVLSFYEVAAEYFIETGNIEAAECRLKIMEDIDKDNDKTKHTAEKINIYLMKKNYEKFKKMLEKERHPKFIPKKKFGQTTEAPSFSNPEVNVLYEYGFQIDFKILRKLLELQRDSLIDDLKKVVTDSIVRYKYFKKLEWDNRSHSFLLHALFLLCELKAEEALDTVLDVLRQDEKFLEYWISDLLTEFMWMVIYGIGQNKLDVLREYILEEGNNTYARTSVSEAVTQTGLNFPERRNEVIKWYYTVLNIFIEQKDNDKLIDTTLTGLMLCDMLDLKPVELEETIIKIYDEEIAGLEVVGELDSFLTDLHSKNYKVFKRHKFSLEEIYRDFSEWERRVKKQSANTNKNLYDSGEVETKEYPSLPEEFRNTGRNEKCPCGSGLKFKKCHGNNF